MVERSLPGLLLPAASVMRNEKGKKRAIPEGSVSK